MMQALQYVIAFCLLSLGVASRAQNWLEEQRKSQQGGAMMVSVDPIALVAKVVFSLLPKRKSKKERQRERLQQVLDNY